MKGSSKRPLGIIAAVAALASLVGCATTPPAEPREERGVTTMCFHSTGVANWQALDDRTLLVWTSSRKRAYRVELFRPIFGLRSESMLALVDRNRDGQICAYGRDGVLTNSCQGGPVSIASIEYLSEARTAELTRGRDKPKDQKPPLQCTPEEVGPDSDSPPKQ